MKTYTVTFSYTVYGKATHIEAETAKEASQWLFDELEQNGIDEFEYKCNDRDYTVDTAEELVK